MRELWRAAADLVLGACCPACGVGGPGVCASCASALAPEPLAVQIAGLTVVAAGRHEAERRDALLAWKVGDRSGFDALMAHHLAAAVLTLLGDVAQVCLVPVPSSRSARRERGRDLVGDLTRRAAAMIALTGVSVTVRSVLRLVRSTRDQHALDRTARERNVEGSMRASSFATDAPVVVVDDVVTTGSTLLEAVRALGRDGDCEVIGAATVVAALHGADRGTSAVASHPPDGLRSR